MAKSDKVLEDSMRRRRTPESIASDVSSTIFGDMAQESTVGEPIEVAAISPSPFQSRVKMDLDHVEALMAQIQKGGLLSPVLLRPISHESYKFEIVAGHHRLEAFRRLKIERIPALVRRMNNAEAARALTSENTVRKGLSDWELYKSIVMLREQDAVTNVTELANVLHVSRAQVYNLEAFGMLPSKAQEVLEEVPTLVGASLVYALKPMLNDAATGAAVAPLVVEAFELLRDEKLKQAGVLGWIQRKLDSGVRTQSREYSFKENGRSIKLVLGANSARISGEFDSEKLHQLIRDNLHLLQKS